MKLRYKGIVIECFDHSLDDLESEDSHDIIYEMVCDYLKIHWNDFAIILIN